MPLRRFEPAPKDAFASDWDVFYTNYGTTVYVAQLFEDAVGLLLVAAEAKGMLRIDRAALGIESVLDRCIGHNLKIFEDSGLWDKKTMRLLKKVNAQRNHLVHRFILDNFTDMISPVGRHSVNEKLFRIFTNIRLALSIVNHFKNLLFTELGYDEEWARKQAQELIGPVVDCDFIPPQNPYEDI